MHIKTSREGPRAHASHAGAGEPSSRRTRRSTNVQVSPFEALAASRRSDTFRSEVRLVSLLEEPRPSQQVSLGLQNKVFRRNRHISLHTKLHLEITGSYITPEAYCFFFVYFAGRAHSRAVSRGVNDSIRL